MRDYGYGYGYAFSRHLSFAYALGRRDAGKTQGVPEFQAVIETATGECFTAEDWDLLYQAYLAGARHGGAG